ncbi:MAG: sugar phosphate isomerase/epimerase family protein [Planctomycetota bacterium]|jgi:sugar phosphate isomerase/epimerase
MRVGIHTDNYRLESRSAEYCFDSIARIGAKYTELNMMQGFDLFQGQGFIPNVSMHEDPFEIREMLEKRGLKASCLDAHYPLWSYRCIEHMRMAILFADQMGVDAIATTDSDELPKGLSEEEAFTIIKYHLGEVLRFADRHKVAVCLEPHGELTNHPEKMQRLVNCHNSEYLRINFDTGNTFVRGWQPQEFLAQVIDKVHHCHVKDVAPELASESRGEETGIISSDVYVGEGVNAQNIIECLKVFKKHGFEGVLCLECGGEARSEASFKWLSEQVGSLAGQT